MIEEHCLVDSSDVNNNRDAVTLLCIVDLSTYHKKEKEMNAMVKHLLKSFRIYRNSILTIDAIVCH